MFIIRKILFSVLFLCLTFSGVANAYADCCFGQKEQKEKSVMMDEPCHDMEKESNNSDDNCNNCGCQHCVSNVFVLPKVEMVKTKPYNISFSKTDSFSSKSLEGALRPPKNIL